MSAGRFMQGDRLSLLCWCRTGAGTPAVPDAAPVATVTGPSGLVASFRLAVCDRYRVTGLFRLPLVLDSRFPPGDYQVAYSWTISGSAYGSTDRFTVTPGGHADGAGLALYYLEKPVSSFVILQMDSGRIIRRRNPTLEGVS